jgi:hypothetical protein
LVKLYKESLVEAHCLQLLSCGFLSEKDSQENPTLLVVFAPISGKESESIGIEENRTKLFPETENAVATT